MAYALSDEIKNHRSGMTSKVTDNQYGRLS